MNMKIDSNTISNGVEAAKNLTKLAANLTNNRPQQPKPQQEKKTETTNQPHSQTVEVKVGETGGQAQKPVIIKEKSETHVHKTFPDNRELNERECEVEILRLKQEHELKMKELDFRMNIEEHNRMLEEQNRKERKEREERDRKEREERRQRERKTTRRILIGCGVFMGATTIAALGYDWYSRTRGIGAPRLAGGRAAGTTEAVQLNPGDATIK